MNWRQLKLRPLFWPVLWMALAAAAWTHALIYSQNILYFSPHWTLPSLTEHALKTGGIITLFDRKNFAGNRLSARQNTLRVLSRDTYQPREVEFDFRLHPNSTLAVIFNVENGQTENLSFSTDPLKQSLHYLSDSHERYLWSRPTDIRVPGHTRVHARLVQEGARLAVYLDGAKVAEVASTFRLAKIGLELYTDGEVWAPTLTLKDGTRAELPFRRSENFFSFYEKNLVLCGLVTGLLTLPFRRRRLLVARRVGQLLFLLGSIWLGYDYLWYSKLIHRWNHGQLVMMLKGKSSENFVDYEHVRYRLMGNWYAALGGTTPTRQRLAADGLVLTENRNFRYCSDECTAIPSNLATLPERAPKSLRLLVMGGSMSFGWGTSEISQVYVERLHHALRHHYGQRIQVETLNISSADFEFNRGAEKNLRIIEKFRPDLLIISVLLRPYLRSSLDRISRIVASTQATTIYLRPPTNVDNLRPVYLPMLRAYYKSGPREKAPNYIFGFENEGFLLAMIKKHRWKFRDANTIFLDPELATKGKKFWDYMHPTDWGHALLASYLKDEIVQLLSEDPAIFRP